MNDGGGNGASCGGITVRTDTMKLSNMAIASFGDGHEFGVFLLWNTVYVYLCICGDCVMACLFKET